MGDLMNMLATKAEELEDKEKKENELKRERLQLAKNLLKEGDAGGTKGKRSSKGSGSSSPSSSERGKSKGSAPPTPSRDNRKSIQTSNDGAFPGIAFHTEADGPASGKSSIRKSPAVTRKNEEKSMEKSQSDNEEHEPKKKKKGKKDKVDEEEQARLEQEEAEREEQERLQREREEAEREEKRLAEKARKKAERKERKRKEKELRAKEEAEREEKARENKEELERIEREEFEREQKEREERERLERERIEREDREEEERERKRKEAEAAAGQKKADEEDLDAMKGEIWEGFFQDSNILDKTMSRASAAFYQELKGGAATLLNDTPGSPLPGGRAVGRLPPNAGPPRGQSQTVRVNQSERAIGKINAAQWENRPKEAPAAPRSTAPVPVSKGSVMEKAKFLQDHKETGLETKSKSEVVPRKLTNTGVLANLEQKLQPAGGPKLPPRQASAPVIPLGGSGGVKPAPPPVGSNKPTLPASAPASPSTPGGGSGISGSPPPPPPGGVVSQDITPLEYQTAPDTGKTIVVAGSLPSLINKLVSDKDDEEGFDRELFVNTFLVVHPLLLTSTELLKNLKDIYSLYSNKPIIKTNKASLPPHVRTLQVVNHWASNFTDNFVIADDGAVRRAFFNWVEDLKVQRENEKKDKKKKKKWKLIDLEPLIATVAFVKAEAKKVKEQRKQDKAYYKKKRAYKEKKKMARNGAALPEKPVPLPEEVRTSIVKEYSAKELAQQLTYADYTLFKRIRNSELFNQNWTKHKERSPNLVAMIRWFNEISMWTMSQIVCIPDEKERTAALRKFIEIGKEMKNLNNYNGIMLILSALNNTAVRRLKSNWEALPKSVRATFVSLQEILNPDENFGNLRTAMRNAEPPVIPFMGLYLTQMTYIDENEDKKDGLVNFNKMHLFGKVLLELKRFQSADYPFKPIPSVQNYLLNKLEFPDLTTSTKSKRLPKGYGKMKWWGEKEVYQQSQLVKPREENA